MISTIQTIQRTLEQSYEWVKILMQDYNFGNENKAFVTLKATLKALRDRLPFEEAVHLGSVLPVLLRGFYYDDWMPGSTEKNKQIAFVHLVKLHLNGHDDINLNEAVPATLKLIFDLIEQTDAIEVKNFLPHEVIEIFPQD